MKNLTCEIVPLSIGKTCIARIPQQINNQNDEIIIEAEPCDYCIFMRVVYLLKYPSNASLPSGLSACSICHTTKVILKLSLLNSLQQWKKSGHLIIKQTVVQQVKHITFTQLSDVCNTKRMMGCMLLVSLQLLKAGKRERAWVSHGFNLHHFRQQKPPLLTKRSVVVVAICSM